MKIELETCPVCKGAAVVSSLQLNLDTYAFSDTAWLSEYHCECVNCGLSTYSYQSMQEAINAWNHRVGT